MGTLFPPGQVQFPSIPRVTFMVGWIRLVAAD